MDDTFIDLRDGRVFGIDEAENLAAFHDCDVCDLPNTVKVENQDELDYWTKQLSNPSYTRL